MAVDKMKLVTIVGPIESMDQIANSNIINSDIHLEDTISVLDKIEGLKKFKVDNPYGEPFKKIQDIVSKADIDVNNKWDDIKAIDIRSANVYINAISKMINAISSHRDELKKRIKENKAIIEQISPLAGMNIKLGKLFDLKFVRIKFGKLPKSSFNKLVTYMIDMDAVACQCQDESGLFLGISDTPTIELSNVSALFCPFKEDENFVFGVIFIPTVIHKKIDAIFSSLQFERVVISGDIKDTPAEAIEKFKIDISKKQDMLFKLDLEFKKLLSTEKEKLISAYKTIKLAHKANQIKKLAAHTEKSFCITAWVTEKDVSKFASQFSQESSITVMSEKPQAIRFIDPPTRLTNHGIFKPFEEFIKMYGIPSYNEIDPTNLIGIIYTVLFGMMFGDVGHGFVLLLLGIFLYNKNFLGKIMIPISISSMFFGFIYGSIFGYEHILHHPFLFEPLKDGNMVKILGAAIGLGVLYIVVAMLMNIANKFKQGKSLKLIADPNGIAGVIFYLGTIFVSFNSFTHVINTGSPILLILLVIIPVLLMFLRVPINKWIDQFESNRNDDKHSEEHQETMLESSFELFEVVLSYATNTISFIRVGAYALSHACIMQAIFMMAKTSTGSHNLVIVIIGNIIVIGLEGLLAGIQVLRLELYELFSRFFSGTGKEFISQREI